MQVEDFVPNTYEEYAEIHGDSFESLKIYRDLKNVINTAIQESIEKANKEMAKNMIEMNFPIERIAEILKISIDEVERFIKENQL